MAASPGPGFDSSVMTALLQAFCSRKTNLSVLLCLASVHPSQHIPLLVFPRPACGVVWAQRHHLLEGKRLYFLGLCLCHTNRPGPRDVPHLLSPLSGGSLLAPLLPAPHKMPHPLPVPERSELVQPSGAAHSAGSCTGGSKGASDMAGKGHSSPTRARAGG